MNFYPFVYSIGSIFFYSTVERVLTNKLISVNQIAIRIFLIIFLSLFLKLSIKYYVINRNMNATLVHNFSV